MREQEAAFLAGAGLHYGIPHYSNYMNWPKAVRLRLEKTLRVIGSETALNPSASREVVDTANENSIALLTSNSKTGERALLLYNFSAKSRSIEVDLEQNPNINKLKNLMSGETIGVEKGKLKLLLEPYGYRFLKF